MNSDKLKSRLQAELFENGISLGSYVTEGEDRLIIGSSKKADMVVPHSSISNIHAMLRIVDSNILLYDLGSEQGTFVNGKKIVESKLSTGEIFDLGSHKIKVSLIEQSKDPSMGERALFWGPIQGFDFLETVRIDDSTVTDERSLKKNGRIFIGKRKNEILFSGLESGVAFLHRKDEGQKHSVEVILPKGYSAEIYDSSNQLVRVIEQESSKFTFNHQEKVRLITIDQRSEVLLFWRAQGLRTSRRGKDSDQAMVQKTMVICSFLAILMVAFISYVPMKEVVVEEAVIPKSDYLRLTMDSAPAPAQAEQSAAPAKGDPMAKQAPSQAASISSSLSKMLNKKSSLTAESIQQAISNNGTASTRAANIKTANMQSSDIGGGSIGGGSVNVNAMSAGLSGGSGKAGALNGFANGKGGSIGVGGSGFGGKGFDMALGGDEAEAIGGLDKSLIAAVVQSNIGQIKHCYERQLIVDPNIFGKIVANWTINKDGLVSVTSVKSTTMNSKPVENCILAKIKGWNFPKPKGGGQVIVSYPFLFKSLN